LTVIPCKAINFSYGVVIHVNEDLLRLFLLRYVEAKPAYEIGTTATTRNTKRNQGWNRNWDTPLWSVNTFHRSTYWFGRDVSFNAVGAQDRAWTKRIEGCSWSIEGFVEQRRVCKGQTVTVPTLESRRKLMGRRRQIKHWLRRI
jgi:hypothetical protein